jgi:hypothetical protein
VANGFWSSSLLLFGAFRLADLANLAVGFWIVPRYVDRAELGAVLPLSTLTSFVALPVFAFAMTAMKEGARLASAGEFGRLKSLYRGVFTAFAAFLTLLPPVMAAVLPKSLAAMRVTDGTAGIFAAAAAVLGCTAPVYMDALQSRKRFAAMGCVECVFAVSKRAVMLAVMPFRALAGYFAGNAAQPLVRIIGSVVAFRRELSASAERFWTLAAARDLAVNFTLTAAYLALPMLTCLIELTVLRANLADADSAGYYMATRVSDLVHYFTLPLLLVMFPYTAEAAASGRSTRPYVSRCMALTLIIATVLAGTGAAVGEKILSLMGTGTAYARYIPWLTAITALNACQTFHTNAEVSAGRFGFLFWFAPLHLAYAAALWSLRHAVGSLEALLCWMTALALLRFLLSLPLRAWMMAAVDFAEARIVDMGVYLRRRDVGMP